MADSAPQRKTTRRGWLATLIVAMLLLAGGLSFGSWIGPSALLRFAVRTADPALRMKMSSTDLHDGELWLRDVQILLRGKKEAIFRAKEVSLGLGKDWRKGRFGSLKLFQPDVPLDDGHLADFPRPTSSAPAGGKMVERVLVECERGLEKFERSEASLAPILAEAEGDFLRAEDRFFFPTQENLHIAQPQLAIV
ncbi:MAG: hypothetical protein ACKOJB_14740 [Chthoniobacterales bacterium]